MGIGYVDGPPVEPAVQSEPCCDMDGQRVVGNGTRIRKDAEVAGSSLPEPADGVATGAAEGVSGRGSPGLDAGPDIGYPRRTCRQDDGQPVRVKA